MSRVKFAFLIFMCAQVCACSFYKPFIDRRRNAGADDKNSIYIGTSKDNAPAICYNGLWTEYDELQKMADAECVKNGTGTKAVFDRETKFSCRLLLPTRIYFTCEK